MNSCEDHPILSLPDALLRELRSDHAGELGAVWIYRGVLAVTRDPALRRFAETHMRTEQTHLAFFEQHLPPAWQTRLTPLWRLAGWMLGALPALWSADAVYRTVTAVETFVDRHYADQIDMLADHPGHRWLRTRLEQFRADECEHRDDAASRSGHDASGVWVRVVIGGSALGAAVARRC